MKEYARVVSLRRQTIDGIMDDLNARCKTTGRWREAAATARSCQNGGGDFV